MRAEEISPDNLLLGAFWDPDHADAAIDAIKGHARECDEPRRTRLLQLASYMAFARALGQLQRKRLLAVYRPQRRSMVTARGCSARWTPPA